MSSFSYIQLERQLFVDKKEFSHILIQDINAEISQMEEANATLRQSSAEYRYTITTNKPFENDIKEYRKATLKALSELAKQTSSVRKKDEILLKDIGEAIKQTAKLDTLQPFAKQWLNKRLLESAEIIKRRIDMLRQDIEEYELEKKNITSFSDEELTNILTDNLFLNQKVIENNERSIKEHKDKIRQLTEMKRAVEDEELTMF